MDLAEFLLEFLISVYPPHRKERLLHPLGGAYATRSLPEFL